MEQADRSATFDLIRKLADPDSGEPERDGISYALQRLGDPRAVEPLTRIGLDPSGAIEVRRAALSVLESTGMCPEGGELRAWWNDGDDLVRACVLRQAQRTEADLLEPVARDPRDRLHKHALIGLEFSFEEPLWQGYKIQGLEHPDPRVRKAAADVLCWDEPVAAEPALHRVAVGSDTEAACAAIDTLRYYHSRATLRLLHEIGRGDGERAVTARASEVDLLSEFRGEQSAIREWIAPVADLLGSPEPATSTARPRLRQQPRPVPSAAEILATYSDPDGPWAPKLSMLRRYAWPRVPAADRPAIATLLSTHPDPEVREASCGMLAIWHEVDALLALTDDPNCAVRKSAVYSLRFVPASPEIATLTWNLITSGEVASTRGYEALATCAAHTPPGDLDDRLIDLARTDLRESIRAEAISQLGDRVEPLLHLLAEPPLVTWAVHTRLLDACRGAGTHIPDLTPLREVDNLHLALALADFDARA
ncbi:hypothetical protein [Nocardia sp. CA-145437]|uniref:hypothetical protein n=1 Tax=Nocardia sp. CA-145437 TaxID=3239980 RepID=UPI003D980680